MKRLFCICLLTLCASISGDIWAQSFQWEQTNGPYGGDVYSLTRVGNTLFAGTFGGVYRSADNGEHWSYSGLGGMWVNTIVSKDSLLFAGLHRPGRYVDGTMHYGPESFFRSTNNGVSWQQMLQGYRLGSATGICGSFILVGGENGLRRSTDNGNVWTRLEYYTQPNSFATIDTTLYLSNNSYVVSSSDYGDTWQPESLIEEQSYILTSNESTVIAARKFDGQPIGGIFISRNKEPWMDLGLFQHTFTAVAIEGTTIFAATDTGGIKRSTDGGNFWEDVAFVSGARVNCILIEGNSVFIGTGTGIFHSTDTGKSWVALNEGLCASRITSILENDGWLYASIFPSGIHRSNTNGVSWEAISSGLPATKITGLSASASAIFASLDSAGLYRTEDRGMTWTRVLDKHVPWVSARGAKVFARANDTLMRSLDEGQNWSVQNTNINVASQIPLYIHDSYLLGANGASVLRSANDGEQWLMAIMQDANAVRAIAGGDNVLYAIKGNVARSLDEGYTWDSAGISLWTSTISIAATGTHGFFGTSDSGIYHSSTMGDSWKAINSGLHHKEVRSIAPTKEYLFAGTGNGGVYRSSFSSGSVPQANANTFNTSISQNPADDKLQVSYSVSPEANVTIELLSLLGNTILRHTTIGDQQVSLNISHLAAGVYILQVSAGDQVGREKVIVR